LIDHSDRAQYRAYALSVRAQIAIVLILLGVAGGAVLLVGKTRRPLETGDTEISSRAKTPGIFYPTAAQWATLTIEPVQQRVFRSEHVTEGKIAVDEDRSTPIFSPYAGRVIKLLVKPPRLVAFRRGLSEAG
jgi:cobalt-zinc-cadmium efflux system membrane fusion protein